MDGAEELTTSEVDHEELDKDVDVVEGLAFSSINSSRPSVTCADDSENKQQISRDKTSLYPRYSFSLMRACRIAVASTGDRHCSTDQHWHMTANLLP